MLWLSLLSVSLRPKVRLYNFVLCEWFLRHLGLLEWWHGHAGAIFRRTPCAAGVPKLPVHTRSILLLGSCPSKPRQWYGNVLFPNSVVKVCPVIVNLRLKRVVRRIMYEVTSIFRLRWLQADWSVLLGKARKKGIRALSSLLYGCDNLYIGLLRW